MGKINNLKKRGIELPKQPIEAAIIFCRLIRDRGLEYISVKKGALALGYKEISNRAFASPLHAARLYGLLIPRTLKLSDLGEKCVYPENKLAKDTAIKEAVIKIAYYRKRLANESINPIQPKTLKDQIKHELSMNDEESLRCARVMIENLRMISGDQIAETIELDPEGKRKIQISLPDGVLLDEEKEKIIRWIQKL